MVYWNAVKAGEYDTWERRCGDLVDSVDGLKWDDLKKNLEPQSTLKHSYQ